MWLHCLGYSQTLYREGSQSGLLKFSLVDGVIEPRSGVSCMASGDPLAGVQGALEMPVSSAQPSRAGTARPSAGLQCCWVSLLECIQVPRSLRFKRLHVTRRACLGAS